MEVSMEEMTNSKTATETQTTAMQQTGETAVAVNGYGEGISGDVQASDTITPALKIVHGVGPLSEKFDSGSLVLGGEHVLSPGSKEGCEPINIVVLAAHKDYIENLEFGSDEFPAVLPTLEAVKEVGGTINWGPDKEPPTWLPRLTCAILVEGDSENPLFEMEHEDRYFTPATWTLTKSAYNKAGKLIISMSKLGLRKGLAYGKWTVGVKRTKVKDNYVFVPDLKAAGKNDEAFVEWTRNMGL